MKRKSVADTFAENIFFSPAFQEKWKTYLQMYGQDMDAVFGDDYQTKVHLASALSQIADGDYGEAQTKLNCLMASCVTENDRLVCQRLLQICQNKDGMADIKEGDWVKDDIGGYGLVISKTEKYSIVKDGFDRNLVLEKEFRFRFTDLTAYRAVNAEEHAQIAAFWTENPEKWRLFTCSTERYLKYRTMLLQAGMKEALHHTGRFYRKMTEQTAFIVNLADLGEYVLVVYGYASTKGDEDWFAKSGAESDDANLRFAVRLQTDQEQALAAEQIHKVYLQYCDTEKDVLLAIVKEKRKAFLQRITDKLKPLGFKKKGAKWTKLLDTEFCLEFYAQKSAYSDQYYFNIDLYHKDIVYPSCFGMRLRRNGSDIHNWQLLSDTEFDELMKDALENTVVPIIISPLTELGKKKEIWRGCVCPRDKCAVCFVEKNLWEAKQDEG